MADKKRGLIARALGVGKKKPKKTITGGYSPDKRSQGTKHGQAAAKKKEQKRHINLLTNDGKGTPRPKVKTAMQSKPKVQGPKKGPASKIKPAEIKRKKVSTLKSGIKKQGLSKPKARASAKVEAKKPGLKFKETRRQKKAKKLSARADKGAASGSITEKKYNRLNKRAVNKAERAKGTRRTVAGTALAGAKRFLGNWGNLSSGSGVARNYKGLGKKPNPAKSRPISGRTRALTNAAKEDK